MVTSEPLLTVKELSQWLQVKESTIRKRVCYNRIPHLKVGSSVRFVPSWIKAWLCSLNAQNAKWESLYSSVEDIYNGDVRQV